MTWPQHYDPLRSPVLSTLVALAPVVLLLGLLATRKVRAEWAAVVGLAASIAVAVLAIGMPAGMAARAAVYGAAYGAFPDRLDPAERAFSLPAHRRAGGVRDSAAQHRAADGRQTASARAHRVCIRRVFRGRRRIRHAGRGDGGAAHRAWLRTARGVGAFIDREHRAGGVRRAGHAADRAAGCDRTGPARALRAGGAPASGVQRDDTVLAHCRVCRVGQDARGLAGARRRGNRVRSSAVSDLELSRAVAGRRRVGAFFDGTVRAFSPRLAPAWTLGRGAVGDRRHAPPAAARTDAVGPALPDRVRLGHAAGEDVARLDLDRKIPRAGTRPNGAARSARRRGAESRNRRCSR